MTVIHQAEEFACSLLRLGAYRRRTFQVADALGGVEDDGLVLGGQETGAPIRRAGGWDAADIGDGDVGWQVVVF